MARVKPKPKVKAKKERQLRSRKPCKFCKDHINFMDYKDDKKLRRFMTERGKITPRRITGTCARHQRILAAAIKKSRMIALVPFVREYFR